MSAPAREPVVAFVEDSPELRFLFKLLIEVRIGIKCVCLASYDEFISRTSEVLETDLIVLDISLGRNPGDPSGVDAHNWLKKHNYKGKIFFLSGHAPYHPLVSAASSTGAEIWPKPMNMDQIVEAIVATIGPSL